VVSVSLYLTGRRWAGIFVGLWAPTFLNLGMHLKQLHPSRAGQKQTLDTMRAKRMLPATVYGSNDERAALADLAAFHDCHVRHVLGYAFALVGARELAEQVSLDVLLSGWRAGLVRETDTHASRLLLFSLVRRELAAVLREHLVATQSEQRRGGRQGFVDGTPSWRSTSK
jgi:hypothetical protein